ncbi:MAG: hypothetical protein N838_13950 [Thiohalocapsa sp. PB-PSB1]|nr:MAG: hypothetical protein N838_13950 [Thiohalocapsa sp. PB-PSB1]
MLSLLPTGYAKPAGRPQAGAYEPWEPLSVGARLRATRQVMPADADALR